MPAWKKTRLSGGGVLLDLASHHVDLVRFLFQQDIRLVYCEIESRSSEQDTATLQLQLADGLRVQSYFSFAVGDLWTSRRADGGSVSFVGCGLR
jgi:predicted dehydrogenase